MWEVGDGGEAMGEGDTNYLFTFTFIGKRRSGVIAIVMSKKSLIPHLKSLPLQVSKSYSIGGGPIVGPIKPIIWPRSRLLKPNVSALPHRISIQGETKWALVGSGGNLPQKMSLDRNF